MIADICNMCGHEEFGSGEGDVRSPPESPKSPIGTPPGSPDCVHCNQILLGPHDNKAKLNKAMCRGSFGAIYEGEIVESKEKVAVKIEKCAKGRSHLLEEGNVYHKLQGGPGIPIMHWFGMHTSSQNALIMQMMGPSLQNLFDKCDSKFSLKTVLLLAEQMLTTVQYTHEKGFAHRDLKPANFVMGLGETRHLCYTIDFGLTKRLQEGVRFQMGRPRYHISATMEGTARFCSIPQQKGESPSRRDDLEALGYMFVYFLKGSLPWQGFVTSSKSEKLEQILNAKTREDPDKLCEGLPEEFAIYLKFVRSMGQLSVPNYDGIRTLFKNLAAKENIMYDYMYDWVTLHPAEELDQLSI